jgi:transposase-like protein
MSNNNEGAGAEKKTRKRINFSLKRQIVSEVSCYKISISQAAKKYEVSRSSIDYWLEKYSTLDDKKAYMSKKDELKKLKSRIEELELIKDFQQDLIAEFEEETGLELSKKYLPDHVAKEIAVKRNALKKGN